MSENFVFSKHYSVFEKALSASLFVLNLESKLDTEMSPFEPILRKRVEELVGAWVKLPKDIALELAYNLIISPVCHSEKGLS